MAQKHTITEHIIHAGLYLITLFSFLGCPQAQKPQQTVEHRKLLPSEIHPDSKYSYLELIEASNYFVILTVKRADAQFAKKKMKSILPCDPNDEMLEGRLMQIKSLMDEQIESEKLRFTAMTAEDRNSNPLLNKCEDHCACGEYFEVVKEIPDIKPKLLKAIKSKHIKMSHEDTLTCVKAMKSLCASSLYRTIMQ